ncbi:hypothetical protein [Haliangium sp.]|uniref:hypothetical protein n=1 Tax=Haliangium sp. TaxID=2663208 RepID=UPI003D10246B
MTKTISQLLTVSTLTAAALVAGAPDAAQAQPACSPPPPVYASKWRIRNAAVQQNTGQWVLREMDFCADPACNQPLGGLAIDSGDSRSWSLPENAFDNDTSTLWKTFDADVAGQSWIGMEFPTNVQVRGLYIKTDNVVYSVDAIYVEYFDGSDWITADYFDSVPSGSELTYDVKVRDAFPVSWRIRNAEVQANSGQWVLREIDFCADPECTEALADGTAVDSGDSRTWSPPEYAFDDDTSTFWKTFDTDVAGQSWLGMDYDTLTPVHGLYLKTDNVVYSVGSIYVEYYDLIADEWVTAEVIDSIPSGSELTYGIGCPPPN